MLGRRGGHHEAGLAPAKAEVHRARREVTRDLRRRRGQCLQQNEPRRRLQRRGEPFGQRTGVVPAGIGRHRKLMAERVNIWREFHDGSMKSFLPHYKSCPVGLTRVLRQGGYGAAVSVRPRIMPGLACRADLALNWGSQCAPIGSVSRASAMNDGSSTEAALPPPGQRPDVLEVSGVTVRFAGLTALDGVTLAAGARQVTGIIGPNGAGKTTLLNVLCGFIRPQSGEVSLGGTSLTGLAPHRLASLGIARTLQGVGLFR